MTAMALRRCGLLMAAALFFVSGCAQDSTSQDNSTTTAPNASSAKDMDAILTQRLDDAIDHAMDQAGVPGAIVGIWGPDGNYVQTYGVADQASGAPMQTDFYHRIGSQTKTFTVT